MAGNITFYLYGLGPIGELTTAWAYSLPDGATPRLIHHSAFCLLHSSFHPLSLSLMACAVTDGTNTATLTPMETQTPAQTPGYTLTVTTPTATSTFVLTPTETPSPTCTGTPTPTPEIALHTVIAACGTSEEGPTAPGPNCVNNTNNKNTHLEDLSQTGYVVHPVRYPGGNTAKMDQAKAIATYSPTVLVCYSGGVDSCLIYATTMSNFAQSMVLIGGGYGAKYEGASVTMTTGPAPHFNNGFTGAILNLSEKGVKILIIYDGNILGSPNITTRGNIQHVNVSGFEDHYSADNPSSGIWPHIWAWIQNSSYQLPYPPYP